MSSINASDITAVLPQSNCTGCGACISACPKDALSLASDVLGYYRSTLNKSKCIDCGLCVKVCPAHKLPEKTNNPEPRLYAFVAADTDLLFKSSSGGIFSLLAKEAFKLGGYVGGAAWRDDFSVEHILIDNENDMPKLRKSKYLQSYLGNIGRKIKQLLDNNRFVLFSGCPCQIAGLKSYLGKEYNNLLLVDLLCANLPSTMFFKKYLADNFGEGKVKDYTFRYKSKNADCVTVTVTLTSGDSFIRRGTKKDTYQSVYHNHTMCPPHCEKCIYQALPRYGDLTIGDFWGLKKRDPSIDYKNGISAILVNNDKGAEFLKRISSDEIAVMKEEPLSFLGGNGYAVKGHNYASSHRDEFYKMIENSGFNQTVQAVNKGDTNNKIYDKIRILKIKIKGMIKNFGFNQTDQAIQTINENDTDNEINDKIRILEDEIKSLNEKLNSYTKIINNFCQLAQEQRNLLISKSDKDIQVIQKILEMVNVSDMQFQTMFWQIFRRQEESQVDAKKRFFQMLPPADGELRIAQKATTTLLANLDQICRKNNLSYWLMAGTLLGAIRHKGFIPWDDDIDVGMMRDDMERLLEIVKDHPHFWISKVPQIRSFDRGYSTPVRFLYKHDEKGIKCFVDIFIFDYADEASDATWSKYLALRKELNDQSQILKNKLETDLSIDRNTAAKQLLKDYLVKHREILNPKNTKNAVIWGIDNHTYIGKFVLENSYIFPLCEQEFEKRMYFSMNRPYEHLRFFYRDFYSLPKDKLGHGFKYDERQIRIMEELMNKYQI